MADNESPYEVVKRFEVELGLPSGFVQKLQEEDDWSFVIKLHALFEGALSYVIVHRLGCDELDGLVSRMQMNMKMSFAKALGMLSDPETTLIDWLSQQRNKCAHRVREAATYNLVEACAGMEKNQKAALVRALCGTEGEEKYEENGRTITRKQLVLENPKWFLWETGVFILALLCLKKETEQFRKQYHADIALAYELLSKQRAETGTNNTLVEIMMAAQARQAAEGAGES